MATTVSVQCVYEGEGTGLAVGTVVDAVGTVVEQVIEGSETCTFDASAFKGAGYEVPFEI